MNELEIKLRALCLSIGGWTASIMLPNYEQKFLYSAVTYNLPADWAALTNTFDESTDNGTSFISGSHVIRNNLHLNTLRNSETLHPVEAVIVVPIKRDFQVIGTIVVISDDPNTKFGEKELRKMEESSLEFANLL